MMPKKFEKRTIKSRTCVPFNDYNMSPKEFSIFFDTFELKALNLVQKDSQARRQVQGGQAGS
jgi:hypothetical protein